MTYSECLNFAMFEHAFAIPIYLFKKPEMRKKMCQKYAPTTKKEEININVLRGFFLAFCTMKMVKRIYYKNKVVVELCYLSIFKTSSTFLQLFFFCGTLYHSDSREKQQHQKNIHFYDHIFGTNILVYNKCHRRHRIHKNSHLAKKEKRIFQTLSHI